ncbi:MAG: hypothetical protein VB997_09965 [Opitutales bacterium]
MGRHPGNRDDRVVGGDKHIRDSSGLNIAEPHWARHKRFSVNEGRLRVTRSTPRHDTVAYKPAVHAVAQSLDDARYLNSRSHRSSLRIIDSQDTIEH